MTNDEDPYLATNHGYNSYEPKKEAPVVDAQHEINKRLDGHDRKYHQFNISNETALEDALWKLLHVRLIRDVIAAGVQDTYHAQVCIELDINVQARQEAKKLLAGLLEQIDAVHLEVPMTRDELIEATRWQPGLDKECTPPDIVAIAMKTRI